MKTTVTSGATDLKQTPKKSTLISNLLNRTDETSLAVEEKGEKQITIYWDKPTEKHSKANKELLSLLDKEDLMVLLSGKEVTKAFTKNCFVFETNHPGEYAKKKAEKVQLDEKQGQTIVKHQNISHL